MIVADVFNGGEGEGEALRELDTADDRQREVAVEEGHEAGGAEKEEDGGSGEAGGGDLRESEMSRLSDGDGGDGFHRLNGHRNAEEEAGGDVVESGEDQGGSEVEVRDQSESENNGDVSAEVAD